MENHYEVHVIFQDIEDQLGENVPHLKFVIIGTRFIMP